MTTIKLDVAPEQFVRIWTTSPTLKVAASRLKWTRKITSHKAWLLRSKGVELKKMPSGRALALATNVRRVNVSALNLLVGSLS